MITLKRNRWIFLAAAMLLSGIAAAQTFPSRTIHLVSGVTPGSASDTTARIIAEKLQASLGQAVIVENKLGVGGLIGAAYVAHADPDGHTISIYTSAFTVAPLLSPGPLDPKELAAVATIGHGSHRADRFDRQELQDGGGPCRRGQGEARSDRRHDRRHRQFHAHEPGALSHLRGH